MAIARARLVVKTSDTPAQPSPDCRTSGARRLERLDRSERGPNALLNAPARSWEGEPRPPGIMQGRLCHVSLIIASLIKGAAEQVEVALASAYQRSRRFFR